MAGDRSAAKLRFLFSRREGIHCFRGLEYLEEGIRAAEVEHKQLLFYTYMFRQKGKAHGSF